MTFLGWLSDPFKGLSDLQPGDEKVTLNHQEDALQGENPSFTLEATTQNAGRL